MYDKHHFPVQSTTAQTVTCIEIFPDSEGTLYKAFRVTTPLGMPVVIEKRYNGKMGTVNSVVHEMCKMCAYCNYSVLCSLYCDISYNI